MYSYEQVSHDPSEIILISRFATVKAYYLSLVINIG